MKKLHVRGMHFYDEDDSQVFMNGICFICREKELGYLEPDLESKLAYYAGHGFNLIRLGIFWDGVEPEPGIYDDEYLQRVKEAVLMADQLGIYVFLDMHQDLYGVKYIDGAPEWATLDEGLPHPEGCDMWYEAYVKSPAIMKAADHFWADSPAADGVGLQEHYEKMWEHIAWYFAGCPNLIGLEPMNEPYMGSIAPRTFELAVGKVRESNPGFDLSKPQTAGPEDIRTMQEVMDEEFIRFDRQVLMPFYRRMRDAVRKHTDAALVTGGNIYCSSFVTTGIEKIEESQIYAPHGYDAVVDSDRYDQYDKANVERVFDGKRASQMRLNLPVIVGEWGNFPSGDFTNDLIRFMNRILEKNLWSSTYHQYAGGMEEDHNYKALERGYPMSVGGRLEAYHYEPDTGALTVKWEGLSGKCTKLYLPQPPEHIRNKTEVSFQAETKNIEMAEGCYVFITPEKDGIMDIVVDCQEYI